MGKFLSKLQQVEQKLQSVAPSDLHDGIYLSIILQSLAYYLGVGIYIQNCFDFYSKPTTSAENLNAKYAKSTLNRIFSGFNADFILGIAHQLGTAHLVTYQMKLHRPLLPIVLFAGTSSLLFTSIAWFYPVKLLVSAELVAEGRNFADFSLQQVFESLSDGQKRFLAVCHFGGEALMLSALLKIYSKQAKPILLWGYLLFSSIQSYHFLSNKSLF